MPEVIEPSIVDDSVADTLETPIEPVEPLEPETPIEPAEPAEPAESQPAPERIADRDVVKWLREQAKTTPDQSKLFDSLRDNYFRAQEFSKLFPEIEQARTLKTHLDAIGGLDGLNELQEVSNDMSELYTQIDSGDPSVIDDIAQNSRDGFLKLVPHALQTLYRVDPRAYDSLITPIITNSVVNSPLVDSISLAAERLQRGETDAALRELTRVLQGFESMRQNGGRQPAAYQGAAQNQGSPPQVANDNGGMHPVAAQILPLVTAHIEQTVHNDVQAALGTVKLASAAMTRLENLVRTEMDTVLGSDANYQNRLQALFRSGNAERSRQFIQASLDQIRPRITRQIVNEMYGPRPAQAAQPARVKPGARPQAPEGTTQLSRPPRHDDIDWSKTDTTAMIAHRAVLKDGRSVRWPYSTK